jgi:CheY-like chemotaxis protein
LKLLNIFSSAQNRNTSAEQKHEWNGYSGPFLTRVAQTIGYDSSALAFILFLFKGQYERSIFFSVTKNQNSRICFFNSCFANEKPEKSTTILYMDDDADDVKLLDEAIHSVDSSCRLIPASNGEEGLQVLLNLQQARSLPCLIVLDLNMPKIGGREVFRQIKANKELSHIPVVIFSTSTAATDQAWFQGANVEYVPKPHTFSSLLQIAKRLFALCKR